MMNLLARPGVDMKAVSGQVPSKKREEMAAVASAVEKHGWVVRRPVAPIR